MRKPLLLHAGCVAIGGRGVLIMGPSGSGKSDLALRLIDRGAALVSDDYTELSRSGERLMAAAPARLSGRIEVRGVGIVQLDSAGPVPVCLAADLAAAPERLPEPREVEFAGAAVPWLALSPLEPSAPIKLEYALATFGLPLR
jgi:serine kinase of HPr protein (carbohydrate metabolism regulator)